MLARRLIGLHGGRAWAAQRQRLTCPAQPSLTRPTPAPPPLLQDDEALFHSEASAFKAAHLAAWEHDLAEKGRLAKMEGDRAAVAEQIRARRAEEFAALKVGGVGCWWLSGAGGMLFAGGCL